MTATADRSISDETAAWLRRYHPLTESSPRRLVCFPHAGGSATFYRPVAARFAPGVEVIAVQYPGRQDRYREPCIDDIRTLAEHVAAQLRRLPPKPTVLFGHSMGTAVAFETAWRLERTGHGPRGLVVSGWRAPSLPFNEHVHERDDAGVVAEVRSLGGTDAGLLSDADVVRMAMPSLRADYRAIETYVGDPDQRLNCPVTALVGDGDRQVSTLDASAWHRHTTASFRLKVLPGGHFYLIEGHLAVADEILADLRRWT